MRQAHEYGLVLAETFLARTRFTRLTLREVHHWPKACFTALNDCIAHTERQIDQVRRRVLVNEYQYGFILNHRVMQQVTDDQVAAPGTAELAQRFPNLHRFSLA